MYELIQAGRHTYYINSPTNIGLYEREGHCFLIDSGGDGGAAEKILGLIAEKNWTLEKIICTHSHADHTGGCAALRELSGCEVLAPGVCASIIRYPYLEAATLFGGFPTKEMRSKFVMSRACECSELTENALPDGLEFTHIDGHDFEQIAVKTDDGVWFAADGVVGEDVLGKYKISFLYDVSEHLRSLEKLRSLEGRLFIPSHSEPLENIVPLAQRNIDNVFEVAAVIKKFCETPLSIDELIEKIFEKFGIKLYLMQYELIGSTTRSYLSWLKSLGEAECVFDGSRLLWRTVL